MERSAGTPPGVDVRLRKVRTRDVRAFFEHQLDPVASRMAAFTAEDPTDREAFELRWRRMRADVSILGRTVLVDGRVAGHVVSYERSGRRMVGYWIDRTHWGRGVATRALERFLGVEDRRPLHACAAKDNLGSLRVLEKCGFRVVGESRAFAQARGEMTDELLLELL